jgi:flagellar motility protein MotE (MotC chaperone)
MRAVQLAAKFDKEPHDASIPVDALQEGELAILKLQQEIRTDLASLNSQALCRTRGQRRFLDELSRAAGLPAHEKELERRLRELAEWHQRIAAVLRRKQREHDDRVSRTIEFVLTVIAAASLAGVAVWANEAYRVQNRNWAWVELVLLAVITIVIGAGILMFRKHK